MSSISLGIIIIVVSDSRNEQTDKSGKVLEDCTHNASVRIVQYEKSKNGTWPKMMPSDIPKCIRIRD